MKKINPMAAWIAAGVIATAVVSAAAYAGYKAFKTVEDLDLDDIFADMNEQFFDSLKPKRPEGE